MVESFETADFTRSCIESGIRPQHNQPGLRFNSHLQAIMNSNNQGATGVASAGSVSLSQQHLAAANQSQESSQQLDAGVSLGASASEQQLLLHMREANYFNHRSSTSSDEILSMEHVRAALRRSQVAGQDHQFGISQIESIQEETPELIQYRDDSLLMNSRDRENFEDYGDEEEYERDYLPNPHSIVLPLPNQSQNQSSYNQQSYDHTKSLDPAYQGSGAIGIDLLNPSDIVLMNQQSQFDDTKIYQAQLDGGSWFEQQRVANDYDYSTQNHSNNELRCKSFIQQQQQPSIINPHSPTTVRQQLIASSFDQHRPNERSLNSTGRQQYQLQSDLIPRQTVVSGLSGPQSKTFVSQSLRSVVQNHPVHSQNGSSYRTRVEYASQNGTIRERLQQKIQSQDHHDFSDDQQLEEEEDGGWALRSLLKEERMNVGQLEEGNRALRDHVNQLETLIALKTASLTDSSMHMTSGGGLAFLGTGPMHQLGSPSGNEFGSLTSPLHHQHNLTSPNDAVRSFQNGNQEIQVSNDNGLILIEERCERLQSLLEHYQQENTHLQQEYQTLAACVDQFDHEKQSLQYRHSQQIYQLETKILQLEQELHAVYSMSTSEKDHTIMELQEHIRALEEQLFQRDLGQQYIRGQDQTDTRDLLQKYKSNFTLMPKDQPSFEKVGGQNNSITTDSMRGPHVNDRSDKSTYLKKGAGGYDQASTSTNHDSSVALPSSGLLQVNQQSAAEASSSYYESESVALARAYEGRIRDLNQELQEMRNFYQAKISQLERTQMLLGYQNYSSGGATMSGEENLIGSFGNRNPLTLTFGEKQRFLEQMTLVEEERDKALRRNNVLRIENQVLKSHQGQSTALLNHRNPLLDQLRNEIHIKLKALLKEQGIRAVLSVLDIAEECHKTLLGRSKVNPRTLILLLEKMIVQMEDSMRGLQIGDNRSSLELTFTKVTDLSLVLSQVKDIEKDKDECENIVSQMKDSLNLNLDIQIRKILVHLQNAQKRGKQETSQRNHSKSTASKMQVEVEELVSNQEIEDDDDEYQSDFSDEDFHVEEQEEKQSLSTFFNLQSWLLGYLKENADLDLVKVLSNFETNRPGLIALGDLQHCLVQLGFNLNTYQDLATLIQAIDSSQTRSTALGMLDYRAFVRDIKSKPYAWWQERIQSNYFESKNHFAKDGSFTKLLSSKDPKIKQFQLSLIAEKISKCRLNGEAVSDNQTKSQFRKQILHSKVPLTRLECHLAFKMLEENGKVPKEQFLHLFQQPLQAIETELAKGVQQQTTKHSVAKQSEHEFKDLIGVISTYMLETAGLEKAMTEWFQTLDIKHDGSCDIETLSRVFKTLEVPLSRFETYTVFKGLVQIENSTKSHAHLLRPVTPHTRVLYSTLLKQTASAVNINNFIRPSNSFGNNLPLYDQAACKENLGDSLNLTITENSLVKPLPKQNDDPVLKNNNALKQRIEDMKLPRVYHS